MSSSKPQVRVHTKSIEAVLSPIAEQVAQLIVLDEKARTMKMAMPNLRPSAEAIHVAVRNLTKVGHEAMDRGDDQLKTRMPAACEQIQAADKLFMDSTMELGMDAHSEKGRSMLVQAARGLLAGTTNVLMTFDAYEVRKIVALGEHVIELLAQCKDVNSLESLVPVLKPMSQCLVQFAQLADARHQELINPVLKRRLVVANDVLRKSSPLLVSALRTYVQNQDNPQARASRDYAVEQVLNAAHEIILVVSSTDLDQTAEADEEGALHLLVEDIQNQFSAEASVKAVQPDLEKLVQQGSKVAMFTRDKKHAEELNGIIDQIRDALSKADSDSAPSGHQVGGLVLALDQRIKTTVVQEMTEVLVDAKKPSALDRLADAATTGTSTDTMNEHVMAFEAFNSRLMAAARHVAASSGDRRRVKMIDVSCKQLESCAIQIVNASRVVCSNPTGQAAKEHLALLKDTYEHRSEVLRATVAAISDPERVVAVAGDAVQRQMEAAHSAASKEEAARSSEAVRSRIEFVLHVAETEVENSEDPSYRDPIQVASNRLREVGPRYAEAIVELAGAGDAHQEEVLDRLADDTKRAIDGVRKAIAGEYQGPSSSDDAVPDLSQAVEALEVRVISDELGNDTPADEPDSPVDDELPPPDSAPPQPERKNSLARVTEAAQSSDDEELRRAFDRMLKPPSGPIADAARSLRRVTDRFSEKENPIVGTAKAMAQQMSRMAQIANHDAEGNDGDGSASLAKGQMIATAKSIAERSKDIVKEARKIADNCSDKRLKADLAYLCDRLPTLSTQLKIIASVKAASPASDSEDADAMLVKNAQNLMESVQRCVRACEAASLRQLSTIANAAAAGIRWKRKMKQAHSVRAAAAQAISPKKD